MLLCISDPAALSPYTVTPGCLGEQRISKMRNTLFANFSCWRPGCGLHSCPKAGYEHVNGEWRVRIRLVSR